MNVVVNGLMTHYEKSGKGKTIVLLHGWGDNSSTFSEPAKYLSNKYTVLIPDLPGMGKTEPPANAWGLLEYSDFVAAWLKKIDTNEVYGFLGHSNGGSIAIYGLSSGNLKAERLILIASAGIRAKAQAKKFALKLVAKSGKLITAPLPGSTRKKIRGKFYRTVGSDITLLPQLEETFKKIIRQDVRSQAAQLTLPCLIIYGQNDRQTPAVYGRIYNRLILGSKLKILPDVGHFPHQESPDKINREVDEFLKTKS